MKTEPLPSPKSSKKSIPKVTRGFINATSPIDLEIITETPCKGDSWIWKPSLALLTQKKSTKTEMVPTGKSLTKNLPKVTLGFGSARSPC